MNKHYPCLDHVNWVVKLYLIFLKPKSVQICPPLAKANRLLKISHVITIKDIDTDKTKEYNYIRAAARELHVSHSTLLNYMDKDKLFKARFIIKGK